MSGAAERAAIGVERREQELIERARRGDVNAYEALLSEQERFSFRVAYVITRDQADAEDAVQEAFIKAFRALPRFRRGAPFRPWLLKIVTNEARTRRRAHQRQAAITARAVQREVREPAELLPESSTLSSEHRRLLFAAIEALPEKQRLVVTCRYLLELSERETATILGIRPGTVKSRLSRAVEKLESLLGGTG